MATTIPILDVEVLCRNVSGDSGLLTELVQIFAQELPNLREGLEAAVRTHDPRQVAKAAHRVKGSLVTLGARCAQSAERLEKAALGRSWQEVEAEAQHLAQELELVVPALRDVLGRGEL